MSKPMLGVVRDDEASTKPPPVQQRLKLIGASNMHYDRDALNLNDHFTGTVTGRCSGVVAKDEGGTVIRTYIIEVLEVEPD